VNQAEALGLAPMKNTITTGLPTTDALAKARSAASAMLKAA
jgi:hypothetical protein